MAKIGHVPDESEIHLIGDGFSETGLLVPSTTTFRTDSLSSTGEKILRFLTLFRLVGVQRHQEPHLIEINNLTIINLLLVYKGKAGGDMSQYEPGGSFLAP